MTKEKYPVGTPEFETILQDKCVYVDKTKYIYDLVNSGSHCFFLSRPRRFGKSLFLSTLEAYFTGKKKLFKGLDIYKLQKRWESYPVLHFDFSDSEAYSTTRLEEDLRDVLEDLAQSYEVTLKSNLGIGRTFANLIRDIVNKTGKKVVILIDEYDKGIQEVLENKKQLEKNQKILRSFFTVLKSQFKNIRFSFITGITRFPHYTLFSGINHLKDISMHPDYAAICGITMEELIKYFPQGIKKLQDVLNLSYEEVIERLKNKYDGSRFTYKDTLVFNPFDLLNCFDSGAVENFWLQSGISMVFVKYLTKQKDFDLSSLAKLWVNKDRMEGTFKEDDPIPLLFQTGYLTIKDYDSNLGLYRLDIPNGEVRSALVNELLPQYLGIERNTVTTEISELKTIIDSGDIKAIIDKLTAFLGSIPYHQFDYDNEEKTYHLAIYSMFLVIGVDVRSEIAISGGRIDMVVTSNNFVYVMEFKLNGTPQEALKQINSRGYSLPWKAERRTVLKVGIVFSSETRNISDWDSEPKI